MKVLLFLEFIYAFILKSTFYVKVLKLLHNFAINFMHPKIILKATFEALKLCLVLVLTKNDDLCGQFKKII